MSRKLQITLTTTLSLVEQFQSTLSSEPAQSTTTNNNNNNNNYNKDPLPLLSASATALKSHVTKLSLLAITSPFTPSAVTTTLSDLNESVLPSLVTAALLVTPDSHTKAFQAEARALTGVALRELDSLLKEVRGVSEKAITAAATTTSASAAGGKKGGDLEQSEKNTVTVAAGRVWDGCDALVDMSAKGVVGFLVRRAEEYRDLVRDAVEEIEEWDPDEEGDEFFDGLLSDDDDDDEGLNSKSTKSGGKAKFDGEEGSAALHTQKKSTLRILKPIAQIYPAIVANRLKKVPLSPSLSVVGTLESLMGKLQLVPEYIDEVAGALYEDDLDKCTRYLGEARDCASKAVSLVKLPWGAKETGGDGRDAGDKFTTWSNTWAKVMEEVSKSIDAPTQVK